MGWSRTFWVSLGAVCLAFVPAHASACRTPDNHEILIFPDRPEPAGLDGAAVIAVRFVNRGDSFERFQLEHPSMAEHPASEGELVPPGHSAVQAEVLGVTDSGAPLMSVHLPRDLIGVAELTDTSEVVPVYAVVTSCTQGFFGHSPEHGEAEGFLVGRWGRLPDGRKAFLAGGNWNGRWRF